MSKVECRVAASGTRIPLWECPCWECWRIEMELIRNMTEEGQKPDTQTYQTWRDERL